MIQEASPDSSTIALDGLQEDQYRFGNLQAIRYDRYNTDLFPEGFLGQLYFLSKASRRRSGNGILDTLFGGNPESTFDAIVSYLAARPLVVLVEWQEDGSFKPAGYGFVAIVCGNDKTEKAAFCGYGLFKDWWGKDEGRILTMLGLSLFFKELNLLAIHGVRYKENVLTKRFTEQFGFRQIGEIPYYNVSGTKLVPGVVSTLLRTDFERYVERFLLDAFPSAAASPPVEPVREPAKAKESAPLELDVPLSWL